MLRGRIQNIVNENVDGNVVIAQSDNKTIMIMMIMIIIIIKAT
jgi:hypothetical protein